eukprot:scaffold105718_cov30-Tisochrysis_lutea.AAC.2
MQLGLCTERTLTRLSPKPLYSPLRKPSSRAIRSIAISGLLSEWPTMARRRTSSNGKVVVEAHIPAIMPKVAAGESSRRLPSSPSRSRRRVESLRRCAPERSPSSAGSTTAVYQRCRMSYVPKRTAKYGITEMSDGVSPR